MTSTSDTSALVDGALQDLREMRARDGYLLGWSKAAEDRVVVHIDAGPDACADCLAPDPVIEAIMSRTLAETRFSLKQVTLPEGEH